MAARTNGIRDPAASSFSLGHLGTDHVLFADHHDEVPVRSLRDAPLDDAHCALVSPRDAERPFRIAPAPA